MNNARISELLDACKSGYSLPQAFYRDQAIYDTEMDVLWSRSWLFAGHGCEIPNVGDYFTLKVGNDSLFVVRDAQRNVRGFFNVCRHRGSLLFAAARGRSRRVVCPYHQWTYDLDGRLMVARDMGEGFNRAERALVPVQCEQVAGYIFICIARDAPDFSEFRANVAPYLLPHGLEEAKVAFESSIVEHANWKLVMENNRECYHCANIHPELLRVFPESPHFNQADDPEFGVEVRALWERAASLGIPSKYSFHGHYRTIRLPFINEAQSMTMTGESAVKRLLGSLEESRLGSMLLFHFPNTWNHALADHALSFRVLPISPEQTLLTTKWLVHKDAEEGVDYTIEDLTRVWLTTNAQDKQRVEENQMGVDSRAYQPGLYSPIHELGVAHFTDWYTNTMRAALAKTGQTPRLASTG